jgi:CSLREA domain-containing protein
MNGNKRNQAIRALTLLILVLGLSLTSAPPAHAATLTVNSLNDTNDGACTASNCTLREAINAANATSTDDLIQFSLNGTINLGSVLPAITAVGGALTVDGDGHSLTISGQGLHRVFYVQSGAELTLLNLEIRDGYIYEGGGILNQGTLTINDSTLAGNRSESHGGAIFSEGTLSLVNTDFTSNEAVDGSGGALYIDDGTIAIDGGHFQANVAALSGGAIFNHYESPGHEGDLTIVGTVFLLNNAANVNGGAISNEGDLDIDRASFGFNWAEDYGGALYNKRGYLQIKSTTFSFNYSEYSSGGALYVYQASEYSYILDSAFTYNDAHFDGGGFYLTYPTFSFIRTELSHNRARRNGGAGFNIAGTLHLTECNIQSNQADQDGGGIYNDEEMAVSRSAFLDNDALGNGGGVYHSTYAVYSTIGSSTFHGNDADQGGGVFSDASLSIRNSTFNSNSADPGGGGAVNGSFPTHLNNSILAGSASGGNCSSSPKPGNWGNNIDSGATCDFGTALGSMSNTNPRLGALQDNGGGTQSMFPLPDSPAIDAVIYNAPNNCPSLDQRGYPRPFGDYCDIGAIEGYFRINLPLVMK